MISVFRPVGEICEDILSTSISSQLFWEPFFVTKQVQSRERQGEVKQHVKGQFLDMCHAIDPLILIGPIFRMDYSISCIPIGLEKSVPNALSYHRSYPINEKSGESNKPTLISDEVISIGLCYWPEREEAGNGAEHVDEDDDVKILPDGFESVLLRLVGRSLLRIITHQF